MTENKRNDNAKNLISNSERTPSELREMTRKGGIASGKARREKRDRKRQAQMILDLAVKDPKVIEKLDALGIEAGKRNLETAMDVSMAVKVIDEGNPVAYKALKEEAYGKMESHDSLDISADISGININIKNYREKDGNRN